MKASKIVGGALAAVVVAGGVTLAFAQAGASGGPAGPGISTVNPASTPAGPGMQQAPSTDRSTMSNSAATGSSMGSSTSGSTMDNSATSGQTTERAAQTDRN